MQIVKPQLDMVSDAVDEVNILKGKVARNVERAQASQFDAEKDKTQFRRYEDACERVKSFYREQHGTSCRLSKTIERTLMVHAEKQTMDFNINARVAFRKGVRARMSKCG